MKEQITKILREAIVDHCGETIPKQPVCYYTSQISALFNTEVIREIFKDTTVTKFELLVNNGKPFMCEGDCSNIINKGDWYCKEVFPVLDRCLFCSSAIMSNVNNECFKALIPDQKQELPPNTYYCPSDCSNLRDDGCAVDAEFSNPNGDLSFENDSKYSLCPKYQKQEVCPDDERIYPCRKCGKLRSKNEGGTTFTICEECWDKLYTPLNGTGSVTKKE